MMAWDGPHRILLSFVVWGSASVALNAAMEIQGDRELLKAITETHKANIDKIKTWQGEAEVDLHVEQPGYVLAMKAKAAFVADRDRDAVRWDWAVSEKTRRSTMEDPVEVSPPYHIRQMLSDGIFFNSMPMLEDAAGQRHNALVIWPRAEFQKWRSDEEFNPWDYLNHPTHDIYGTLLLWYNNPNDREISGGLRIDRTGERVRVVRSYVPWNMPSMGLNVFEHEFDLSQGGNLTRYRVLAAAIHHEELIQWTYKEVRGAWLPSVSSSSTHNEGPEGENLSKRSKRVEFTRQTVNEPLDASAFTVEAMGVAPGTPVTDHVEGTRDSSPPEVDRAMAK
jgi:hypothetical protein